jgi:RHS repeat-associated protein
VEIRHATGSEPELLRQRGMLEGVCGVEFPLPEGRFAGRGIVICGGAVDSATLNVRYAYADGSDNTVRPTGITYPDGTTTITTAYGGTAADALSRPDALKEGGTTLCSYRYLGSGMIIGVKYDAAGNVEQTFRDGGAGDAGDPYTGLDRFGRLIETLWKKGTADKVRSQYGRNRFGGVVWRRDGEAHAQGVDTEDNDYGYDGLYQVKERQRGDLTGTAPDYTGITNLQQEEDWTYDATGNWAAYSDTSPTNAQTRTHNAANEITQIAASPGNINPDYDPAGNMTTLPRQLGLTTGQFTLKWDAWNRLAQVKDGGTLVASYTYDGLTRRLTKTNATETRHYYYNDQWRALEERVEGAGTVVDRQYTWGLRDRWDLLRRKRSVGGSLGEALYVLRDYIDPVAIVGGSGAVLERYAYDAFGNARFLAPDYSSRSTSDFDWNFLFHAEFLDTDTSLYHYGYRYYAPALGRWLTRDPIEEEDGFNLYAFSRNDAINAVDSLGLEAWFFTYDVKENFESRQPTTPIPGAKPIPTLDTTHAVTELQWDIEPYCECISKNNYKLRYFVITLRANIRMKDKYRTNKLKAAVLMGEFDHWNDYMDWAKKKGSEKASEIERQLSGTYYGSPEQCEKDSRKTLEDALKGSVLRTNLDTVKKYDHPKNGKRALHQLDEADPKYND